MGKKLTYDFVKAKFEEEGYTLISDNYVNSKTTLECVCSNGHTYHTTANAFNAGYRCCYCAGKAKKTIEEVRESFASEGCTLLSTDYVNAMTKLDYICSNGHKHSIKWNDWRTGYRCSYCYGNTKLTFDEVKVEVEVEGYFLVSEEYINIRSKLMFRCPEGHTFGMTFNNWAQGNRCPICAVERQKLDFSIVQESFINEGYTLLTTNYINSDDKLNYVCPNGHDYSVSWNNWNQGHRCIYCLGLFKPTIEEVRRKFVAEGYQLLSSEYINAHVKLVYKCPYGHEHSISLNSWNQGNRCGICAKLRLFGETNPNWNGGITYDDYCDIWKDKEYKFDLRERDGHKCLNPYCTSKDPTKLVIHHINYNKKDCHPNNLITVCNSCNARANYDRDWHQSWYQAILMRRYNYKY